MNIMYLSVVSCLVQAMSRDGWFGTCVYLHKVLSTCTMAQRTGA